MTDETKLPPLMLDDLRMTGPSRDDADAFEPAETWWAACDKIAAGYPAADVAGLLLEMDAADTSLLWCWWRDECMEGAAHGTGREADCPDLLLLAALNAADVRAWRYPLVAGESAADVLAQRDRALALLRTLAGVLDDGTDAHPEIHAAHDLLRTVTGIGLWAADGEDR